MISLALGRPCYLPRRLMIYGAQSITLQLFYIVPLSFLPLTRIIES